MSARNATTRRAGDRQGPLVVGGIAVAALIGLAVVVLAERDGTSDPAVTADAGVSHVHGLGVNPADGSLIVATHYGAFRIAPDSDRAERIGASFQDTMGFTVAGPNEFLGSGHPDVAGIQAGDPTRLGLIESIDAGETWTILSLGGEADFHALATAHERVFGWDAGSGRFLVSEDRRAWEERSTVELFGFVVDPRDADHIVAATPNGLAESVDGGRSWSDADGPALVVLSWPAGSGAWGADAEGKVWRASASGWERAGTLPGSPQAFLATDDALFAAVHDEGGLTTIHRSRDGGESWQLRYRDEPT